MLTQWKLEASQQICITTDNGSVQPQLDFHFLFICIPWARGNILATTSNTKMSCARLLCEYTYGTAQMQRPTRDSRALHSRVFHSRVCTYSRVSHSRVYPYSRVSHSRVYPYSRVLRSRVYTHILQVSFAYRVCIYT